MQIGIVGNGYVGKATALLASDKLTCVAHDIIPEACQPPGTTLAQVAESQIVFVCVPTPMEINGYCHLGIVERVVGQIREINETVPIVVRSTVPPGTCQRLQVHSMPEFLTEVNWEDDFKHTAQWVVGWNQSIEGSDTFKTTLQTILTTAVAEDRILHSEVEWLSTTEAEMVKYLRNCFLATKVCFFNEIEEFCQSQGIDFETVRKTGTHDPRIGGSHSHVPGPDGLRGFGGRCLTKDLSAMCTTIESSGIVPTLLRTVLNRNIHRDRQAVIGAVKSDSDIRAELNALSLRELRMMAQQRGISLEQTTAREQLEDKLLEAERKPPDRQPVNRSTGGPAMFQISPQQERDLQAQHQRRREQREQQIKAVQNQRQAEAESTGRARPRTAHQQQPQAPLPPGMSQHQHQMLQQEQRAVAQQQQQLQRMSGRGMAGRGMGQMGGRGMGQMGGRGMGQMPRATGGPVQMGHMPRATGGPVQMGNMPRATGGPVQMGMGNQFGTTQSRGTGQSNTFQFSGGIQNSR